MSNRTNRRVLLAARPQGEPKPSDFELAEGPAPDCPDGAFLARTVYLSLDPYMRGRMNAGRTYADPVEVGGVMEGGTVGVVEETRHPGFAEGDIVAGRMGWQDYGVSDGEGVRKVDPAIAPMSTALGVLGMPGMTAYTGLLNIGKPQPGETVAVAAASGAVGGVVGQIAKIKGCRAVGIAGGPEKCAFVTGELGFDACVDRRAPDFAERLAAACPKGIDVYFENVGGETFQAAAPLLNMFSRVPVCGLIAHYNDTAPPEGPNLVPQLMMRILTNRILFRGFIVRDYANQSADFLRHTSNWIRDGKLKYREDFIDGLENAPEGLIGLLKGRNFGKLVVRVSDEPAGVRQ